MDTNKAAYWIALGVLALGLNSEYQHGSFVALHRVAERGDSLLCRMSTRAEQTVAVAVGMTREDIPVNDLLAAKEGTEMARAEAEMAREQARARAEMVRERVRDEVRAQADVIRERVEMEREQIEQMRWHRASQVRLARTVNHRMTLVCPKTGARITVRRDPEVADIAPEVEVGDAF